MSTLAIELLVKVKLTCSDSGKSSDSLAGGRMRTISSFVSSILMAVGLSSMAVAAENDPLHVVVSLQDQYLKVYRGRELVTQSNISSGKAGNDTPTGVFSVLQKNRHHRSNIYSNAPMPFMQRLTWSGIALHASNHVPDHPASHGCIRLPHKFAGELFRLDTRGMHVVIEKNPQIPHSIDRRFRSEVHHRQALFEMRAQARMQKRAWR